MASLQSLIFLFLAFGFAAAQMYYGSQEDKRNFDRDFMHFGKRSGIEVLRPVNLAEKRANEFDRSFMHFGKRLARMEYEPIMEKKQFNREFMHFGKRSAADASYDS